MRTKAVSLGMAVVFVVLSLSTGVMAASLADFGMEVGFKPEYQKGADAYASDNALFEQYENAICVHIVLYGAQEITVYSAPVTVGELLSKLSLTLGDNDVSSVELSAQITEEMNVSIDRVEIKELTQTEEIPYKSETVENSKLAKGTTRVKQGGVPGMTTTVITETYVNGVLSTSEIKSEETTDPVTEIIEVGTYVEPQKTETPKSQSSDGSTGSGSNSNGSSGGSSSSSSDKPNGYSGVWHNVSTPKIRGREIPNESGKGGTYIDSNGDSYEYLYYIDVIATAYGYSAGSLTATGLPVGKGKMAVDPKLIPYHTRCYVTGNYGDMGVQVAEDCGNFRGNWIDLFLGDDATCRRFGKRTMRVYVLA